MFLRVPGLKAQRKWYVGLWLVLILAFFALPALAGHGGGKKDGNTAIVLATFGSTVEQQDDPAAQFQAEVQKKYPGIPVVIAYTSNHVIKTLRERGKDARSLAEQLGDLGSQGYTHVAVQSLHMTPGAEFDAVRDIAGRFLNFPKGIQKTAVGLPLIATEKDAAALAAAFCKKYPAGQDMAVVLAGHGALGTGSLAYSALQGELWAKHPLYFVGTIEGAYGPDAIAAMLKEKKVKKVKLIPLLTVVGDHALNDIFGDSPESWKSALSKGGVQVEPVAAGIVRSSGVAVGIWMQHLQIAMDELQQ